MPKNQNQQSQVNRPGSGGRRPRRGRGRERPIRIRSDLRAQPDIQKIASSVVALAIAQAEKEAQAERQRAANPSAENSEQTDDTDPRPNRG